jgi:alanine racemase
MNPSSCGGLPASPTLRAEDFESNDAAASRASQPPPRSPSVDGAFSGLVGMSSRPNTSRAAGQDEVPQMTGIRRSTPAIASRPALGVAPVTVEPVRPEAGTGIGMPGEPASLFHSLKAAVALTFGSPAEKDKAQLAALYAKINALRTERPQSDEAAARATVTMTIDLDTFRENYRAVKRLVPESTEMSVVLKADAYGVGAGKLAKALEKEGCNKFFVATLDEALKMRAEVKPETTVMVLGGPLEGTAKQFLDNNITPVLNSVTQVQEWNRLGQETGKTLPAILQFDTGMSRAGIAPKDRAKVAHGSDDLKYVDVKYVMSHLATAGEATLAEDGTRRPSPSMEDQHKEFMQIKAEYPGVGGSLAASAALHIPEYQKELVRVGGIIHGQKVFDDGKGTHPQPVTVTSRLAEVREINKRDGVGYGLAYRAGDKRFIGTIPAGYADGLPRALGGTVSPNGEHVVKGHVKINGQPVDIVGKMSMDMTTVDLNQLLLGKMAEGDGIGTDPDLRLWTKSPDGSVIPDEGLLARAKVVIADKTHTFDDVANEAGPGENASSVSIALGSSPRGVKVYNDNGPARDAPGHSIAARFGVRMPGPPSADEIAALDAASVPNAESMPEGAPGTGEDASDLQRLP